MSATDIVRALVQPIIEQHDAELYDIEYESGVLRIAVDRDGGIDVDTIGELSRRISDELDREDPIPDSKYMLEVTSPGVERKLRTPAHFQKQLGEIVSVKLRAPIDNLRRLEARVVRVGDEDLELSRTDVVDAAAVLTVAFSDIESARSVYDWSAERGDTRRASSSQSSPEAKSEKAKSGSPASEVTQ